MHVKYEKCDMVHFLSQIIPLSQQAPVDGTIHSDNFHEHAVYM